MNLELSFKESLKDFFESLGITVSKRSYPSFNTKNINFDITYMDIGASYGLPQKWKMFENKQYFNIILVEPDGDEAKKIQELYPRAAVIPVALGSKKHKANLNITYGQPCSSILEPNDEVLKRFPVKKWFKVVKKVEVDIYPFESLVQEYKLRTPDFIKIDVQGYESEVLEGFGKYLDNVLCIELETHLIPMYKNEKTLAEINAFLNEKGFMLRQLTPAGPYEGEVVEFDAYYIKRPENLKSDVERAKVQLWEKVNKIPKPARFATIDTF